MTQQANPFDAMGQSFNALQGAWDQRTRNQAGRAYAGGDIQGATNALAGGGMLPEAQAMRSHAREDEERARGGQITDALRGGDFAGAQSFAKTPEELAAIQQFRTNATKAEVDAAAARAGQMVAVISAIENLPPEQQLAAARQYAPQFGIDPAAITPESINRQALEALRIQALGLEEYLKYQDREADNRRPMVTPFGIMGPVGAAPTQAQPRSLGSTIPQGWSAAPPRPNQPARGQPERAQQPSVSFRSSNEARQAVTSLVPGVQVTNADRTPADTARIRRQGYNPSETSFHLRGQALDLVPPAGMTMAQLETKMRQAGFRVLNEGHHVHVSW